ncbi:hypothetical protein D3C72_1069660 [compost metagenome]
MHGLGLETEFVAIPPEAAQQDQQHEGGRARLAAPVEVARARGRIPAQGAPGDHAQHDGAHQPYFLPEEFHRFLGAGFEDDAQVVRGNALAIKDEQVDFRRQGQEGGHQQPVEVGGALEDAPDGQPGQQLEREHLPRMLERTPQQRGDEGHGRQRGIRQEQDQIGGAKQGAHKGGREGSEKCPLLSILLLSCGHTRMCTADAWPQGKNAKSSIVYACRHPRIVAKD